MMSVCLTSVAYIGPKLGTERPKKTRIGTDAPKMHGSKHFLQHLPNIDPEISVNFGANRK